MISLSGFHSPLAVNHANDMQGQTVPSFCKFTADPHDEFKMCSSKAVLWRFIGPWILPFIPEIED